MTFDAVIVGAGVIGLACAERLAADDRSVLVIERNRSFGEEISSRNSEVIHAGIYYPTGTLKARRCVEGNPLVYEWCERHDVRCSRLGKFIIATSAEEEPALEKILRQAHANGVTALRPVEGSFVREQEPNVVATAGLWSPDTGIVDSHGFMRSLLQAAKDRGCAVAWQHRLKAVDLSADGYVLHVEDPSGARESLTTRMVINAAGLCSDEVAALGGIDVEGAGYTLTYVKGRYFRLRQRNLIRHLVYPVPPAGLTGLGVHVTLDLGGGARLGPDVEVLPDRRTDYDVPASAAPRFLEAASRYLKGLVLEDLTPDQSGIRPKLGVPGGAVRDFVVAEESSRGLHGWVNLIGIESPGLTASLAIAREVEGLLVRVGKLEG